MRVSIRLKLILAILLLLSALTVVLALQLEADARDRAVSQIRLRGEVLARMLAINSADELGRLDDLRLAQFVVDAASLPDILYAMVVNEEGIVFAHSDFENGRIGEPYEPPVETVSEAGGLTDFSFEYEGEPTRDVSAPIEIADLERSRLIGEIHVGISEAPVARAVEELRVTVYTTAGIALGAAAILAIFYGIMMTRPLRKIAKGVQRIGEGDLAYRIKIKRRDEIGDLGRAVNGMAARLEESQYLRNAFRLYVSRQVADQIIDDPAAHLAQSKGQRREVSVMFADICDFTPLSEKLQPEEVVSLLNVYLGQLTESVFAYNGTLDKFIGDCVMAVFGAPLDQDDHALRSILAALEMRENIALLNQQREKEGKTVVEIGIGLSVGHAIVGNIGSSERLDYTAIGDTVNLASRLEGVAGRGEIIVSEELYNEVSDYVLATKLTPQMLKGKSEPVICYNIFGLKSGVTIPAGLRLEVEGVRADEQRGALHHSFADEQSGG